MIKYPDCTAPAPTPEMALPIMKTTELGATAQIKDPISNNANAIKKTIFAEYLE